MSNVAESSSSASSRGPRGRGRVMGVPKRCWCGSSLSELISKSENNPYRRYYRCAYAASQKLMNDEHTFKWVDEALRNEIEALQLRNGRLENEVKEIVEKVQVKLENEILQRMEIGLVESSNRVKKIMIVVVLVCMLLVGCSKLIG